MGLIFYIAQKRLLCAILRNFSYWQSASVWSISTGQSMARPQPFAAAVTGSAAQMGNFLAQIRPSHTELAATPGSAVAVGVCAIAAAAAVVVVAAEVLAAETGFVEELVVGWGMEGSGIQVDLLLRELFAEAARGCTPEVMAVAVVLAAMRNFVTAAWVVVFVVVDYHRRSSSNSRSRHPSPWMGVLGKDMIAEEAAVDSWLDVEAGVTTAGMWGLVAVVATNLGMVVTVVALEGIGHETVQVLRRAVVVLLGSLRHNEIVV
jgi:hypothetical protein